MSDIVNITITDQTPITLEIATQGAQGASGVTEDYIENALVSLRGLGATLTYTGNKLTNVAYADGSSKTLTYTGDKLTQVNTALVSPTRTYRRTLAYTGENLTSITDELV